jgi:organic radical activating enzyme
LKYKNLNFDIECGMELFTVCNYRCEYCSGARTRKESLRGRSREDIDQVIRFFNQTGKRWLLGMSGGEPTIHPHFRTLIEGLRDQHCFYFFTNLSFDVDWFTEFVPPERVQYIKASLHPQANPEEFMNKFKRLEDLGYNPILIMVSAPDQFDRIREIGTRCRDAKHAFTLSVMQGPYRGGNYPNDFNADQREFIETHTTEPGSLIRLFSNTPGGLNTLGMTCPAGKTSFTLDMETGDLLTCEAVHKNHGNVYQGTFTPRDQCTRCPAINSCVGYDRSSVLPTDYQDFFRLDTDYWQLKPLKESADFPKNLYRVIRANNEDSTRLVQQCLDTIFAEIKEKKTLFWGAGIYGGKILYYLRQRFGDAALSNVIGYIDSQPDRQQQQVLGLPVYAPTSDEAKQAEAILITSYAYASDILQQALRLDLQGRVIPMHQKLLQPLGVNGSIF